MKIVDVDDNISNVPQNGVEIKESTKTNSELETGGYWEVNDLPSRYYFYPEGTKIYARPLNVSEVKSLSRMDIDNSDTIINKVLMAAVKGIDHSQILTPDKFYLILWLRANTYRDSGYEISFKCPHCLTKSSYNFTVDALDIIYAKDNTLDGRVLTLPESKKKVKIKLKRILDEKRIEEFSKMIKNTGREIDMEEVEYAAIISEVDGVNMSLLNSIKFISSISPIDFSYIDSYMEHINFGVSEKVRAVCNNCKEETPQGVTFQKEFFLPKHSFE